MDSNLSRLRERRHFHAGILLSYLFFSFCNFAFHVNVCDESGAHGTCVSVLRLFIFAIYHFRSFFGAKIK